MFFFIPGSRFWFLCPGFDSFAQVFYSFVHVLNPLPRFWFFCPGFWFLCLGSDSFTQVLIPLFRFWLHCPGWWGREEQSDICKPHWWRSVTLHSHLISQRYHVSCEVIVVIVVKGSDEIMYHATSWYQRRWDLGLKKLCCVNVSSSLCGEGIGKHERE